MSGVFGAISKGSIQGLEEITREMASSMVYGKWYVSEAYVGPGECMALGRIGIGIFNRAAQPVWSSDGSLALVMAGEFTGAPDRRTGESDEALALRLYQEHGPGFAARVEGAFIIAIFDRGRNQLVLTNDRFGLYPTYYTLVKDALVFAPEVKAIFNFPGLEKELDNTALAEYTRFQYLLGEKTFFEGIRLLRNASVILYEPSLNSLTGYSYWDFSHLPQGNNKISFNEAVEEGARLLQAAVNRLTADRFSFGVYLSGGLDSRVILGMVSKERYPLTTITFGRRNSRDAVYAQELASRAGTDHHFFEFTDGRWVKAYAGTHLEMTEGFHSWIHMHGISILDQVKPLIDVNLTGYGGAEINWEDPALLQAKDDHAFTSLLYHHLLNDTTWPSLRDVEEKFLYPTALAHDMVGLAFDSLQMEMRHYEYLPYEQRASAFSRLNSDRRMFQYYSVFNRSRIEQRFPFCDYRYTEFIYTLPAEMLFQRKLRKAIILKALPAFARISYDKDNLPITDHESARLARKALQRGKAYINARIAPVFPELATLNTDYENWLRTDLQTWGEDLLLGERTVARGIFNPAFLRSLWDRHQSGLEVNFIGKLAPLMTWEMMARRFLDN